MGKRYKSVVDLVKDLTDDKQFVAELRKDISDHSLSAALATMRCRAGFTQKDMAGTLECTQSRISKLENAPNDGINIKDLRNYAEALKLQLHVGFGKPPKPPKPMKSVDAVKFHAFEIKRHLDHLAELAQGDEAMKDAVGSFFGEYMFNSFNSFRQSAKKLALKPKSKPIQDIEIAITSASGKSRPQVRKPSAPTAAKKPVAA